MKKRITIIAVSILLFAFAFSAFAQTDLWGRIADRAGDILGNGLLEKVGDVPTPAPDFNIGAAGDVFRTRQYYQKGLTAATSTPVSMYNDSSYDRFITVWYYINESSKDTGSSTVNYFVLRAATSSDAYTFNADATTNTRYVASTTFNTTTSRYYRASSTVPLTGAGETAFEYSASRPQTWEAGSYLNWKLTTDQFSPATTSATTTGMIGVEYYPF